MKVTVFAKKRKTKEGKSFTSYIGRLNKKDGEILNTSIKFREECGAPRAEDCPVIIEFPKEKANLAEHPYINDMGEEKTGYELWVSEWKKSSEEYVDHSLDEFE